MTGGSLPRFLCVPILVLFLVGCACASSPGGLGVCLDESGIQGLQAEFLADSQAADQKYMGRDLCLEGIVAFSQHSPDSLTVAVNLGDQVSAMLHQSKGEDGYQELVTWADNNGEGDSVRIICRLTGFVSVEGAHEPMAIPAFNSCSLAN